MRKHMQPTAVRRAARALAMLPALVVTVVATPALAAPPESWEQPDNGSKLDTLLLLGGVPLLLFAGIWLLVSLPSIMSSQKYDAALAFRDQPEWFGGPRQGAEAAPPAPTEGKERGGAGANW